MPKNWKWMENKRMSDLQTAKPITIDASSKSLDDFQKLLSDKGEILYLERHSSVLDKKSVFNEVFSEFDDIEGEDAMRPTGWQSIDFVNGGFVRMNIIKLPVNVSGEIFAVRLFTKSKMNQMTVVLRV